MKIYALSFYPYDSPYGGSYISGVYICSTHDTAVRALCVGMGFKNLNDYINSYHGKFLNRKTPEFYRSRGDKPITYNENGHDHYVNIESRSYGLTYHSQCVGVINDLNNALMHDSIRSGIIVLPKKERVTKDMIGCRPPGGHWVTDEAMLCCFCYDWEEPNNC